MTPINLLNDVTGTELSEECLRALLNEAAEILAAIRKLRSLDLTDVHPAVVYDPLLPWRGNEQ